MNSIQKAILTYQYPYRPHLGTTLMRWGLFPFKSLKSEIKHKFEQKVKNVSINRKYFIDNYTDLVSIETFNMYVSQTIAMFY